MIALIWFVLAVLASPFKSKSRLEAENAVLRHQLIVLRRRVRDRAQPTNTDRWFFVQMYRCFPSILKVVTIVQLETLVSWLSLSETLSGWRWTENRAMLLFNKGSFQAHWLGGCRSIAVAGSARGRDLDIAAANKWGMSEVLCKRPL